MVVRPLMVIVALLWSLSPANAAPAVDRVFYLTDLEGMWNRWQDYKEASGAFSRNASGELNLTPGATFIFGGDAIDREEGSLRILDELVTLKERFPERVHLLIGNRDLNKLHLRFLSDQDSGDYLSRINAGEAFEMRRRELLQLGEVAHPTAVFQSLREDVTPPRGLLYRYLRLGELGTIVDETLYVHGAVTENNFLKYPESFVGTPTQDVRLWVTHLNHWKDRELTNWAESDRTYRSPLGSYAGDPNGVIYARFSGVDGNSLLPSRELMNKLKEQGIRRIVVGHTPNGEFPTFLRDAGFEVVIADNSYCPGCKASFLEIEGPITRVSTGRWGEARTGFTLNLEEDSIIGKRTRDGFIVTAISDSGDAILYRVLPGFKNEYQQVPLTALKEMHLRAPIDCTNWLKESPFSR